MKVYMRDLGEDEWSALFYIVLELHKDEKGLQKIEEIC
jgi:hypothetical protein